MRRNEIKELVEKVVRILVPASEVQVFRHKRVPGEGDWLAFLVLLNPSADFENRKVKRFYMDTTTGEVLKGKPDWKTEEILRA